MNEEEKEKESRLPEEKLTAIRILASAGLSNTEIAEALDISRKTAARYRPDNEEPDDKRQEPEKVEEADTKNLDVDAEISAEIFRIFDEGGSPITAVKSAYPPSIVHSLWERFCDYKNIKHPRQIQKKIQLIEMSLLNLLGNIRFVCSNASLADGEREVIYCPKCREFTEFVLDESTKQWVCKKCQQRPFHVRENDG